MYAVRLPIRSCCTPQQAIKAFLVAGFMSIASCSETTVDVSKPGTGDLGPEPASSVEPQTSEPANRSTLEKEVPVNELAAFVPSGAEILDQQRGDLTGRGTDDVVLVIDPPATGNEKLGEGQPRTVMLLMRDGEAAMRKAATNDRIVPCARCGGVAGDPYGYARVQKGRLTISTSGGSRERWANDYTFQYSAEAKDWLLEKVVREVTDTATERSRTLVLQQKDFGSVGFEAFDPDELEMVQLIEEEAAN